ncbi:hypothetical protein EDC56_0884 [Sinobacterium caligoides]|uniref:TM2 domain-containing protein n=1 Tax=Sinobacterium caligoides TaxID=933926 RepID=A0A3N2DZU3_9GAMM|nr:hypothetical protein [Sinobacterium caligoides]ROS05354.1 hypothetical protein EDC56_0884 [Sinobacterium caligoides]
MNKSTKSLLFSILLFPGSGYFVVEQKLKGILACSGVIIAITILFQQVMALALPIAEKVTLGEAPLDPELIRNMLQQSMQDNGTALLSAASWFIFAVWIISSIDCFRLGKKIDQLSNN